MDTWCGLVDCGWGFINNYQTLIAGILALFGGLAVIGAALLDIGVSGWRETKKGRSEARARAFQAAFSMTQGLRAIETTIERLIDANEKLANEKDPHARAQRLEYCRLEVLDLMRSSIRVGEGALERASSLISDVPPSHSETALTCASVLEISLHRMRILLSTANSRFGASKTLGDYTEPASLRRLVQQTLRPTVALMNSRGDPDDPRLRLVLNRFRVEGGYGPIKQRSMSARIRLRTRILIRKAGRQLHHAASPSSSARSKSKNVGT